MNVSSSATIARRAPSELSMEALCEPIDRQPTVICPHMSRASHQREYAVFVRKTCGARRGKTCADINGRPGC